MKRYFFLIIPLCFIACTKGPKKPPIDLSKVKSNSNAVEVPYDEMGGVKMISVKINGVSMDMIYDTGCSGISLSNLELIQLCKQGKISESDILGADYATIADGSIVENLRVRLNKIEIEGYDGNVLVFDNIEATVMDNMAAPVLLGNIVLDKTASQTVNTETKTIIFMPK